MVEKIIVICIIRFSRAFWIIVFLHLIHSRWDITKTFSSNLYFLATITNSCYKRFCYWFFAFIGLSEILNFQSVSIQTVNDMHWWTVWEQKVSMTWFSCVLLRNIFWLFIWLLSVRFTWILKFIWPFLPFIWFLWRIVKLLVVRSQVRQIVLGFYLELLNLSLLELRAIGE